MIVSFVVALRRIVVFGTEVIMRSPPHDGEGLGLLPSQAWTSPRRSRSWVWGLLRELSICPALSPTVRTYRNPGLPLEVRGWDAWS